MQLDINQADYRRAMAATLQILQAEAGLSYTQTVKRAALGPGALGKYLAGSALPSMATLVRLCAVFDVNVFAVVTRVYEYCLVAQGRFISRGGSASARLELAAVLSFAGLPASAALFAHGCCNKSFGCRCAPQCTCSCAGCHLASEDQHRLFESFCVAQLSCN